MSATALAPAALLVTLTATPAAWALVQEPNGIMVPAPPNPNNCANTTCTGGRICSDGMCEMPLSAYFMAQGETIDSHADASVEPGVFLPLCDFAATLVLSESRAEAGIAWYNQPAAATGAPTQWFQIGPPVLAVGQVITSTDIRSSPNYMGGLVGFALLKTFNGVPTPIYFSEYQRNQNCTRCTIPGYWKMALAYRSKDPNAYYVAFEDWEGANQDTWFGNDGDFNDKVFKFSGVTCNGGGESCDTKMPGVCALGVTQCQVGAAITCVSYVKPKTETCDNLDNDCNGMIDDNATCSTPGWVCDRGVCVHPCDEGEFKCLGGLQCMGGLCKDPRCAGVTCSAGQICRAGQCVGGCTGVVCPIGQECVLGLCVDPCADVTCPGAVCEKGACVTRCGCRVCAAGQTCAASGHCVDNGCQTMTCAAGFVCRGGSCKDACAMAACPGGAACRNGMCDPPPPIEPTGAAGTGGPVTGVGGSGGTGTFLGNGGTSGSAGRGGSSGGGPAGGAAGAGTGPHQGPQRVTCGCAVPDGPGGGAAIALLLVPLARRRPRRR